MSCVALRAERHYLGRVAAVQGGTPVGGLAGRSPAAGDIDFGTPQPALDAACATTSHRG